MSQHHSLSRVFFLPMNCLGVFVKKKKSITHKCEGCFWTISSVPLIYMHILVPVPHCLDNCSLWKLSFQFPKIWHVLSHLQVFAQATPSALNSPVLKNSYLFFRSNLRRCFVQKLLIDFKSPCQVFLLSTPDHPKINLNIALSHCIIFACSCDCKLHDGKDRL